MTQPLPIFCPSPTPFCFYPEPFTTNTPLTVLQECTKTSPILRKKELTILKPSPSPSGRTIYTAAVRIDDALIPPEEANSSQERAIWVNVQIPRADPNASEAEDHDKVGRISWGSARYRVPGHKLFLCSAARKPEKCFTEGDPEVW